MAKIQPEATITLFAQASCIDSCELPHVSSLVQAGFSSVCDEHIERNLDINELIIKHPTATFFVRVEGNSMEGAHICSGDILVVDKAMEPANNKICVCVIDGEFVVKRLVLKKDGIELHSANPAYKPIIISKSSDFRVWGVVTYVISAR